jgi:predicted DNA-binding protein with PD1-like motif
LEYANFGSKFIIRIDKGEKIVDTLKKFCMQQNIKLASFSAIGAVNRASVGIFMQDTKEYHPKEFSGSMEIVSLQGTITQMDGKVYPHLHIALSDHTYQIFGGHLNEAWVGATCEAVLDVMDGRVERKFSEEIGLNLFSFI